MSEIPNECFLHLGTTAKMKDISKFLDKYNCLESFMTMCAYNQSPYLSGYHGISHIIKCLNTLYLIYNDYKHIIGIDWQSVIQSLIWHDFNYLDPENDSTNTEIALQGFLSCYTFMYNNVPDMIYSCIKVLEFPYTFHIDDSSPKEFQIVRDCDMSMILYEDYFDTMYLGLLKNEFKNKKNLVEIAIIFIESLHFYNKQLKEKFSRIGKHYLKKQAIKYIVSEQRGKNR